MIHVGKKRIRQHPFGKALCQHIPPLKNGDDWGMLTVMALLLPLFYRSNLTRGHTPFAPWPFLRPVCRSTTRWGRSFWMTSGTSSSDLKRQLLGCWAAGLLIFPEELSRSKDLPQLKSKFWYVLGIYNSTTRAVALLWHGNVGWRALSWDRIPGRAWSEM